MSEKITVINSSTQRNVVALWLPVHAKVFSLSTRPGYLVTKDEMLPT